MQITISVVKGTEEGKFNAKFGTSKGGGQERIKNATAEEVANKLKDIIEDADVEGFVGKK